MSKSSGKKTPKSKLSPKTCDGVPTDHVSDFMHHDCPFFKAFLDEATDPIFIFNPEGKMLYLNKAVEDLFGVTAEQVKTYDKFMSYCYPDKKERAKASEESQKDMQKKSPPPRLRVIELPDGSRRWFYRKIKKLNAGNVMMIGQDVTDIKNAEFELERAQYAVENAPTAAYWMGADARFIYVNKKACRNLGYTKKELLSMCVPDIDPLFPADAWPKHWKKVHKKKQMTIESVHRKKNGEVFPVEITISFDNFQGDDYLFAYAHDISARKKAEEALEKAQLAVDNASDAISWLNSDGQYIYVNKSMCKALGYSRKQLLEMHVYDIDPYMTAKSWPSRWESIKKAKAGSVETVYRKKDGTSYPVEVSGTFTVFGEEEFVFAYARDISVRKEADKALLESESSFKQLSDLAFEGILIHDMGKLINANKRFYDMYGCDRKDFEGKDLIEVIFPASEQKSVRKRVEAGDTDLYEAVSIRSDGSEFPVEVRVREMDYESRKVRAVAIMDVTYRRQVEDSLRESEQKFRQIVESSPIGMYMYQLMEDGGLVLTGANPAADRITNVDNSAMIGMTIENAFPPLADTEIPQRYKDAASTGKTWYTEQVDYEDERIRGAFEVYAFQTAPGMMVAAFWDITARKEAEAEMKRLAAAVESAAESIVITDSKGDIIYVNPWFETMTGYSIEEAIGEHVGILASGKHDTEFYKDLWATISSGDTWRGHFLNKKKDGSIFEEDAVISPVKDSDGLIVNYVAVKRDVTQEMLLEHQVMQSQKMAAIGQLAHKIAHNFTNVLVMILGNAQLAKDTVSSGSETAMFLDEVINAANRVSTLTAELLSFSHPNEPKLRKVRLNKALIGVDDLLRETVAPQIELLVDLSEADYKVNIDAVMMEQVLIHLAINSEEAMRKDGGILTIKAGMSDYGEGFGMITVEDTGEGLTEDVKKQIFDPFFSTKSAAKNSGLGLATVYSIVSQHGGFISVDSEIGQGTTFKIYLPLEE